MVASGNDFVVLESDTPGINPRALAVEICDRKYGAGSDGMLLLTKSPRADVKMRIFNADGSEAEMCGNGARCAALYVSSKSSGLKQSVDIQTKAGIIQSRVESGKIKIRLTAPRDIRLGVPLRIYNRALKIDLINTGVPHAVIFVEGLDKIDPVNLGRAIRYHKTFAPKGTNVDFVEVLNNNSLRIRTYERGVEDETLACGTGSAGAALIFSLKGGRGNAINVHTFSGEVLRVYFEKPDIAFRNIWLEGCARIVYKGVYYRKINKIFS